MEAELRTLSVQHYGVPVVGCTVRVPPHNRPVQTNTAGQARVLIASGRSEIHITRDEEDIDIFVDVEDGPRALDVVVVELARMAQPGYSSSNPDLMLGAPVMSSSRLDAHRMREGAEGQSRYVLKERYEIVDFLGKGGMGEVYSAHDLQLDRTVALKILSAALASSPEARDGFIAEAKALAKINHPNVISVYDVLRDEDKTCMVMEYVDGLRLDQVIIQKGDELTIGESIELALQLLAALASLHDKGLIHRDVKPGNVMVDAEGVLRVMDFGLARNVEKIAKSGTQVRGTPAYMAPEQIRGQTLTPATDIYAFGVTFFELLTGELPFDRGDAAYEHVHTPAPDIRTRRYDIPARVAKVIGYCLAKSPSSRPPNARSIMAELAEELGGSTSPTVLPDLRKNRVDVVALDGSHDIGLLETIDSPDELLPLDDLPEEIPLKGEHGRQELRAPDRPPPTRPRRRARRSGPVYVPIIMAAVAIAVLGMGVFGAIALTGSPEPVAPPVTADSESEPPAAEPEDDQPDAPEFRREAWVDPPKDDVDAGPDAAADPVF